MSEQKVVTPTEAGYRVEHGDDGSGILKWWWTCFREGWGGVETSEECFDSESAAWADVERAFNEELGQTV